MLDGDRIRAARMVSLLLAGPGEGTPLEVVRWFGAMQAQDVASGHWSLGVRCPGIAETDVLAAFERGEIVRTWPMRGTIHLVPARDVTWLLELTGVRALSVAAGRQERLGLGPADGERAAAVLDVALSGGLVMTRRECLDTLTEAGFDTSGQRGYHLLWHAAHLGVLCIGPQRGSDQTFVRLADWAPDQIRLDRQDALTELLFRYVRSHGPVSLKDFSGWSGLTLTDARRAAAANDGRLSPLGSDATGLWCTNDLAEIATAQHRARGIVVALPGFDEFLLGYKDRSLHLPAEGMERVVPGGNGMFRSTIVVDGRAVATWSRTMRTHDVRIDVEPFATIDDAQREAAERSLGEYAAFLGRQAQIRFA